MYLTEFKWIKVEFKYTTFFFWQIQIAIRVARWPEINRNLRNFIDIEINIRNLCTNKDMTNF